MNVSDQIGSEGVVVVDNLKNGGCCKPSKLQRIATIMAKAISIVMIPFFMPLYAIGITLWGNTILSLIKPSVKWYFAGTIGLITILIPVVVVWILYIFKIITDIGLNERRQRIIPILATAACYAVCAYVLTEIIGAFLLRQILIAGVACMLTSLIITFFWKISLHMIGAGGLVAILLWINMMGLGDLIIPIMVLVLCSGLLASARLYLGRHTPMQVFVGFVCGFFAAFLTMKYIF